MREHAFLEVYNLGLLEIRADSVFECLMNWILVDIVGPVLVGVELDDEGMAYSVLQFGSLAQS